MKDDRAALRMLLSVALLGYGVYGASLVYGMAFGSASLLMLMGFSCQAIFAFAAALGVWRRQSWAAAMVVLLGISIAATWLVEGFVLQIVGYLYALLVALFAVVLAVLLAQYLDRERM